MPDRREWDRPATTIAAVLGVLVVGGSLPFTVAAFCEQQGCGAPPAEPSPFDIGWAEAPLGQSPPAVAREGTTQSAPLGVADSLVSGFEVVVQPNTCTDDYAANVQEPGSFQYALVRILEGSPEEPVAGGTGTFACPDVAGGKTFAVAGRPHPDVGQVEAFTAGEALAKAWQANPANETARYELRVSASRPPGTLPPGLPIGATTLTVTVLLRASQWSASAQAHPEVVR